MGCDASGRTNTLEQRPGVALIHRHGNARAYCVRSTSVAFARASTHKLEPVVD
jgi:hypothetical protein